MTFIISKMGLIMKTAVLCEGKTLPEIFTLTSVCGIGQTLLPFKSRKIKLIKGRKAEKMYAFLCDWRDCCSGCVTGW